MRKVSSDTVEKVARLARLRLTEKEVRKYARDLNSILSAFRTLDKVDVKNVRPSFQPLDVRNVVREDLTEPSLSNEQALANAQHKERGYFKGPRIV